MSELPVPAKTVFSDFSFDLTDYKVERSGETIATLKGLANSDEGGNHISFLYGADVKPGDVLISDEDYIVKKVKTDTYHGNPELIKAYF